LHARAQRVVAELRQLPPPDEAACAHSERLVERLQQEMVARGGAISFARYMELALYAPGLGYYSAGSRKLGAEGDFVTAPEISPLFSRCLARQVCQVLQMTGGGVVLEVGAGSGVMAADMLAELERLESLPERYLILEVSADLRQRQQMTLEQKVPGLVERVSWLERLPERPIQGVVVANELLDALPVHCFQVGERGAQELLVASDGQGFHWVKGEFGSDRLAERVGAVARGLPPGYRSEISLAVGEWVSSMAQVLGRGVILLIDYGFPRHEYYHPQRADGTLMCHYRHRTHPDPLILPGLQDITAHVDFTTVAEAALEAGLELYGYTTQAHFLLANGLDGMMEEAAGEEWLVRLRLSQQIKTLVLPEEMGELFKVMGIGRGLEGRSLAGFRFHDMRGKL